MTRKDKPMARKGENKGSVSQKILPQQPKRTPKAYSEDPKKFKVRKEFKGRGPLKIRRLRSAKGPRLSGYACTASWEVLTSEDDENDFLAKWEEIGGQPTRLFHGTRAKNVAAITQEGLRTGGRHSMFGKGIYFGQMQKAIGFTGFGVASYIFDAQVLLGTPHIAVKAENYTRNKLACIGCHSIHGSQGFTQTWGATLRNDEWVVYTRSQVLLEYLHEYQYCGKHHISPVVRFCEVFVTKEQALSKKNRAFKDILSKVACGTVAHVRVNTIGSHGYRGKLAVCNSCIKHLKLRVGSKVQVRGNRTVRVIP